MRDFTTMKRVIRKSTDADLLKFRETFGHWIEVSNRELIKRAKKMKMEAEAKDRAAVGIYIFRERTQQLVAQELKRRGIE